MRTHVLVLVVLDDAAHRSLGRDEGAVEHVDVDLAKIALLLDATPHFERTRLCRRQTMPSKTNVR